MAKLDYSRTQRKADKLISRFGQPTNAILRRTVDSTVTERDCTAVMIDYKPYEQGLRAPGARRLLVSPINPKTNLPLDPVPHHENDQVIFAGEILNIVSPVSGLRPGGTWVYFDLEVIYNAPSAT